MAWQETHPEFKVPRSVQRLVDLGMIVDSTLPHDVSPTFDAVLRDGSVLTIFVDHPLAGKRVGQEKRYRLRIYDLNKQGTNLAESDSINEVMEKFKEVMAEEGGPRMGWSEGWYGTYEYVGY
jgi:hypothetical protein